MKKYLLFCLLVIGLLDVFAQEPSSTKTAIDRKGKIVGTVIDSLTSLPAEYSTVALLDVANKNVNGALCDEKGQFIIEGVAIGEYKLVVVFIGYKKAEVAKIKISDSKEKLDVGVIHLRPIIQSVEEVIVEGRKDLVEEKVDRTVYNAENDATNRGGDATDVLRKAPMLSVDMDGTVSLRGSSNVRILINGKPSTITSSSVADALKQIPADQIKSVEIITSPSSKYDAEGTGGIINIITKRSVPQGISLSVDASFGIRASSLGLNSSYRKKKMGFSLGGSGRASYNTPGEFYNNQVTTNADGSKLTNVQQATTRNNMIVGQYTAGWDYDINKRNSITTSVKYSVQNGYTYQDKLFTQAYQSDSLTGINTKNIKITSLSYTIDANANYTHLFTKPQRELSVMMIYSRNNRNYDFTSNVLDNQNLNLINHRTKNQNNSYNQEATLQVDYQTPIAKNQLLEIGVKNVLRKVTSSYQYLDANGANDPYVFAYNGQLNNQFNYNQNVSSSYLTYALTFLKSYTLKAGLRYEYTLINADFQNQQIDKINIPSYGIVVPSINIAKKLANGDLIKASFNRRLQRPNLQSLNPNIQASSPLNVTVGNPYLKPEYGNSYELSYTHNIKRSSFTTALFMRNMTDDIQLISDVVGADTVRSTYQNLGIENDYGTNLSGNLSISNRLTLSGGADIMYREIKNNNPNPYYTASNTGWSARYRLSGTYDLARGWAIQVFGTYRGRRVQLQGYQGGFGMYSLSVRKEFKNKKGSIGLGMENFFTPTIRVRTEVSSQIVQQISTTTYHSMNIKVNFNYIIGKIKAAEKSEVGEIGSN